MLKFAFKLAIFILPIFVLLGICEYKARSIPSNFAVKRERLEKNLDRAQIIVAGSSHAYYGIKPSLLGAPAVSIAYPGQDFYYDTRILLKYLPQASQVRLVIVTVPYLSLEYMLEDSSGREQTNFYYKYWEIPRQTSVPKIADYSALVLFGVERSRNFLLAGKVSEWGEFDEDGGMANVTDTNLSEVMNGQSVVRVHHSLSKAKYITQNTNYLDELLNALKQRNIKAVFITTPCSQSYHDNINAERYWRMQDEIQTLGRKYEFEYSDYLKDNRFVTEDFADSNHLNTKGAEKFTRILKDEIVEKYISNNSMP